MECLGRLLHCIYLDKNLALVKDLSELSTLKELACNVINDLILTGIFADRKLEVSHVLIVRICGVRMGKRTGRCGTSSNDRHYSDAV